jgi:hypothetical protein
MEVNLSALTQEVSDTEGTDESVLAFIQGLQQANKDAVAKAIADTQTADQATKDAADAAAQTAIDGVTSRFVAARGPLAAAIVANPV